MNEKKTLISVAQGVRKLEDIVYNISQTIFNDLNDIDYPRTTSSINIVTKLMEAKWWMDQLASNLEFEQKRIDQAGKNAE